MTATIFKSFWWGVYGDWEKHFKNTILYSVHTHTQNDFIMNECWLMPVLVLQLPLRLSYKTFFKCNSYTSTHTNSCRILVKVLHSFEEKPMKKLSKIKSFNTFQYVQRDYAPFYPGIRKNSRKGVSLWEASIVSIDIQFLYEMFCVKNIEEMYFSHILFLRKNIQSIQ